MSSEPSAVAALAAHPGEDRPALRLRDLACAALAALAPPGAGEEPGELALLAGIARRCAQGYDSWGEALLHTLKGPAPDDLRLLRLAADLALSPVEILAVALGAAVEEEAVLGRALARLQAPLGGSRPTISLVCRAFRPATAPGCTPWAGLFDGAAVRCGLLTVLNEAAPVAERTLAVPPPLCLALAGCLGAWPGVQIEAAAPPPLHASAIAEARRHAAALAGAPGEGLLIRTGSPAEGRAAAALIAGHWGMRAAFIEAEHLAGLGPWLKLLNLLPVFVCKLAPSERRLLPAIAGYSGPRLALSGPDGAVDAAEGPPPAWRLGPPDPGERESLWLSALGLTPGGGAERLPRQLARHHRHGAGRIAQLGRLARRHAALGGRAAVEMRDVEAASWFGEAEGLASLAEPIRERVGEESLVAPAALRRDLDLLRLRCRDRDGLADDLGTSARARYRPGVRALFTGASGTGKTLAACWLATRLGIPLFRVDLAGVTSKYIGETEKNLAQLLARAEQAEVVLLFDEADSLFGKRTDIRDSNDRFANAQTNYLLQRIESYDGVVVLTSNSKARFDAAFARRLDCVIEFPLPAPDERRALWLAHLGPDHGLAPAELNQLAALADVAGGHIRNAVLTAALLARQAGSKIGMAECARGLEAEYRKINRPLPGELENVRPRDSR